MTGGYNILDRRGGFAPLSSGGVGWWVITFVALAHMVDATQHDGVGGGVRKDVNVCRTCTHG